MITPFLEGLILKNRAFFKTLSLGFSSFLTFPFQENRVYIITEIRITPFFPGLVFGNLEDTRKYFTEVVRTNFQADFFQKMVYQLAINNSKNQWLFNVTNDFSFSASEDSNGVGFTYPSYHPKEKIFQPYLLIDQPTLFTILFPSFSKTNPAGTFNGVNEKFDIVYNFKNTFENMPYGPNNINFRVIYGVNENAGVLGYLPLTAEYTADPFKSSVPNNIREFQIGVMDQSNIIEGIYPDNIPTQMEQPDFLNFPRLTISYVEILNKQDFETGIL
jgi:hypothetical protein